MEVHHFHHAKADIAFDINYRLMRERIRPILTTEEQLVVVYHLIGPFLQRFNSELARKVFDLTIELYEALAKVSDFTINKLTLFMLLFSI